VHCVAAFPLDAVTTYPPDFALVRDGGVAMFWRTAVLESAEADLGKFGYEWVGLDAATWDEEALHRDFAAELGFPAYYGNNMNALADCLGNVAHGDYGWHIESGGLAVSIRGFAPFARRDPELATLAAKKFVMASREALIFGHRLVWLLHVDDVSFRLPSVGCIQVPWNGEEWLAAGRR